MSSTTVRIEDPALAPAPASLHGRVYGTVVSAPRSTAIRHDGRATTYEELWRRAGQWHRALTDCGVGPGHLVGVCLDRTPDLIAALLGVLRAGAAYVPLDPAYPRERTRYILDDAHATVVMTHDPRLAAGWDTISPDDLDDPIADDVMAPLTPDALAYVIYTSGSTGRPKGVAIEHRQVDSLVEWSRLTYDDTDRSGVLASTSVCFDLSVYEIFVTLGLGGTIILADNALALPQLADRDLVRLINSVPSAMRVLVEHGSIPPSVRTINLAGEPLTRRLADGVYGFAHVERLYNLYGPSEDTTYSTWSLVPRDSTDAPAIGVPLPGTQAYVLDADLSTVAPGESGELYLAGAGVARGYLGQPELTAERFIADPFCTEQRMYRTGDVCSWGDDHQLRYHGRLDHQIKLRGFRIELGEIEDTLRAHPRVAECAAIVRRDESGEDQLVAFIECGDDNAADVARQAADGAAERLPTYMRPSSVIPLATLPLTPNGKIDRGALQGLVLAPQPLEGTAPDGEWEEQLAADWAAVLQRDDTIFADIPFAALGGSSLAVAGVLHRIAARTGQRLPMSVFPVDATIRELAMRVAQHDSGPTEPPMYRTPADPDDDFPIMPVQAEFFVLDSIAEAPAVSVMSVQVGVSETLDREVLQRALDAMPHRHEALRCTVRTEEAELRARLTPPEPVSLVEVPDTDAMLALALEPIDLLNGHLLQAAIVREADEETLLLRVHHAGFDGWSILIFLRDLAEVYAALLAGRRLPAPPRTTYPDGARWLADRRAAAKPAAEKHWAKRLEGVVHEASLPPTNPDRRREGCHRGGFIQVAVPADLAEDLDAFVRSTGITANAVISAISALRVHRATGESSVLFRAPVGIRRHPDLEEVVGPFTETALVRVDVDAEATFESWCHQVTEDLSGDLEHSWVGVPRCGFPLMSRRDPDGGLRDTLLVAVQNYPRLAHEVDDVRWEYRGEPTNGGAKTELGFFWELGAPTGVALGIEYSTDAHTPEGAEAYGHDMIRLLRDAVSHPSRRVRDLRWADPEGVERATVINAHEPLRPTETVADQIAHHAQASPEATAIVCPRRGAVTYGELHHRALDLAEHIRRADPSGETRAVAVACRRSADGVVGMLAAWYAGHPYLPVDVTHPRERLMTILEDAGATIVVGDGTAPAELTVDRTALPAWASTVSSAALPRATDLADPAYLIFTSGSTGRPKGVVIGQSALASFVTAMGRAVTLTERDVVLNVTTPSFDIAGLEWWLTLASGARIAVATDGEARDGFALAHRITSTGVSVAQMTPSGWRLLLDSGWQGDGQIRALIGAEPVPPEVASALLPHVAGLWNVYGPTEATIWSTTRHLTVDDVAQPPVPIGAPLGNTHVHILDHDGQPVPAGTTGLIYLSGTGLADGYHERPDLTSAAFHEAPWLPGSPRIYRTGDQGRIRPDGQLECLGRVDNQVKVRGVRIELEEVDAALRALPGVVAATAAVRTDATGVGTLVGYVVRTPQGPDVSSLAERLRATLPDAMVPTMWQELDTLPLNAAGKVDRRALPEPDLTPSDVGELTELEELLAEVWVDHLPVSAVGPTSSFLDLGGHSLIATRMVAEVRSTLDIALPVASIFRAPQLRAFAALVEQELLASEGTA